MKRRDIIEGTLKALVAGSALTVAPAYLEAIEKAEQQQQQSANVPSYYSRPRKPVIPQQVIDEYRLTPVEGVGFGLWVMGEDGKPYSMDDVIGVLFTIVRAHWGGDENMKAAPKKKSSF